MQCNCLILFEESMALLSCQLINTLIDLYSQTILESPACILGTV